MHVTPSCGHTPDSDGQAPAASSASTWLDGFLLQPLVPGDAHQPQCTVDDAHGPPSTPAAAAALRMRTTARDGALAASVALMLALRDTDAAAETLCALGYAKHLHVLLCTTVDAPLHVASLQSLASMLAAAPCDSAHQLLAHQGLPTLLQLAAHGSGQCVGGVGVRSGAVECLALLAGHDDRVVVGAVDGMLADMVAALRGCVVDRGCRAAALAALAAVATRASTCTALYKVWDECRGVDND